MPEVRAFGSGHSAGSTPAGPDIDHGYFPLSAAQMNIYFAQKLAPEVPFTVAQYVEIHGDIDPATLIRATDIACRDLESPGVRLTEIDGQPLQRYDDNVPYAMTYRDLRGEVDPVAYAQQYMDEHYKKPLDLVRDQLIVSEIIQVGDAHYFWYSRAHHVVMDGLGAISVQERTAAAYTAIVTGTELRKTRAVSVREIYDYEVAYPGSSRYETDRQYWLGRLDGHSEAPRLAGTPRSGAVPSRVSVSVGDVLDPEISAAMADVARRYNSSDVPVVLAAFSLYLARMTDTEDVMLSLPVSGRATTKLRDSSGMMSNIVPLRIGVESGVTVEELLRRIQVELTGALRHQRFRVEDMQRSAGSSVSSAAGRGVFGPTVNIMMYNSTIRLGDVIGEYRVLSSGPIDDMMVNVYPGVAGASTRVDFLGNPAVYSTEELAAHHARFLDLLRAVVEAPDGLSVSDLQVQGAVPADIELADTRTAAPQLLTTLLASTAVICADGVDHSASELTNVSKDVAAQLVARGAAPEVRIAVALDRSYHSVLAMWAVATAGASFVPMDPADPADRIASLMRDANVRFGMTSRAKVEALPGTWIAVEDLLAAQPVLNEHQLPEVDLDNEAYVIHTSGSTGKPKAVSITHDGLSQLAANVIERYGVTGRSRVLHLASPVFDASVQEILMAFSAGATLVIAPADVYAGPALAELLASERITHLVTSPTVLATLAPSDLDSVEVFDVGGEECPPALRDRFASTERTMLNAYGPTEATVVATVSAPMAAGERITIGGPLPGVRAAVLDSHLRPAPSGGIGELYLGGDGIARGYDGQAGLTAERFVAGPGGVRLYRTGDVVRRSIDGVTLEYLGRSDSQVQLQGRRLELGEIEAAATSFSGVTAATAAVREDRLILYVTGTSDGLDAHLRDHLPGWMVPRHIVVLAAMPMTAGGKLDRRALPTPSFSVAREFVEPRTDTERLVAAVFSEVLGAERVGREDTFFELGGDSLSATRVLARLGTAVSLPALFDAPSVAAVAAAIDSSLAQPVSLQLLDTVLPERIPLSYAQQRMWFLNQFDASSPAYNMPVAVQLQAQADPVLVMFALRDVLERHESLRTYFPDDGNGPRQVVRPSDSVLVDIPTQTVTDLDDAIDALAAAGFDVAAEVPIRAAILAPEGRAEIVVVIVLHHISIDGWSIDPLVRDFTIAHAARSAGHAPTWPRLPAQYSQYAVWNRAVVDAVADEQLNYWTTVLGEPGGMLAELPTDRPRPAVQSMTTEGVPFRVDADLHERLRDVARTLNATTFMVVHAAFAAALSRFGDSPRTIVGSPSAGRGHEALDDMVGMFVGTVPLAVTVNPNGTFTELVAAVRRTDLDAFAHADLPFERIVDALATDRSLDRHPLFQVMLAFDNVPHQSVEDLPVSVLPVETHTSEFDLNLVLTETADGMAGQIEYAVDLYDRSTVDGFAKVLLGVISAVAENPDVIVGDLAVAERERAPAAAPRGTLVDVLGTARDVALDGVERVTYHQLDQRSNRLARLLISLGAGAESLVALSLERSADYIVALCGVAKSGAAFVPIDPHYPTSRRELMLDGITLGFGGTEAGVRWINESDAAEFSSEPIADGDRTANLLPEHPAYVIHTSGSTGTPKPVTVTHGSVHALAEQVVPRYGVTPDSRVLQGYSTNFDAAILELVLAFGGGATMVIAPPELVEGDAIASFLTEQSVTHYLSTPAVLATVPPVAGITTIAVGGDVLGSDVVREWSPGRRMLNAYGPTEATVVATLTDPLDSAGPVTIGRPLDHVSAQVLDRRLQQVPVGGVGELYLGGSGLARGYGTGAALTAERFVAAPGGVRVYRTGDLVRRGAGGVLDYRGRIDTQVQIRGVRIELGDIEAALAAHPDVRGAVASVNDNRILAWVVGLDEQAAKRWLLEKLPLAMVPSVITPIDRIPLTSNGKVDVAALPSPLPATGDPTAVRTLAEEVILGIFADTLGVSDPSADSNFFVLGGDSLVANRAATRIGAALGTHVPVRTLFESPTAHLLAAAVEKLSEEYVPLPALVHDVGARAQSLLAPAERRLWVQNRYDPTSTAYNIAFELPLPPDTDLDVLRTAIADVVERHIPLRTVYPSTPAGPAAVLIDAETVVSSMNERHSDAAALVTEGFDLTVEPPVRMAVTRRGDELLLTVVAHHIAVDGLSLAPLARDVDAALTARFAGVVPEFTPLAVDYADYRVWQQDVLAAVAAEQLDYWRVALAGLPEYLDLPTGTPNPAEDATPIEFGVDADTLAGIRSLAHRLGATVFVVVHAALAAVLAEASGTQDIAIGTPVSGRTESALDDLVGMFVGTVVLRTAVAPTMTFEEFVVEVRDRDLDAFANASVPFEWVVDAVNPARTVDSHPLFQVLLAFGQLDSPTFEWGGDASTPRRIEIASTQFDLEVVVEATADGLLGRLGYSGERFSRSVGIGLAERLTAVLELIAVTPQVELGSVDFVVADRNAVGHRDGADEYYTLGALFGRAAVQWPDNVAVIDGDMSMTYKELDRRSTCLSNSLIRAGVGSGSVVAVALPRSAELLIALWAVAKTGAGYLPIDPTQPAARVEEILTHARPATGIASAGFASAHEGWLDIAGPSEGTPATSSLVENLSLPQLLDSVAYVIYTSGSTGVPKGVRVTHRGIADLVQSQRELFDVEPSSRVLHFASPGFDASVFEMLLAVGAGAAAVIVPAEVYAGRQLEALIDKHSVTHACLTPTVLQVTDPNATPSLRVVIMAGEAVNSQLLQRWSPGRAVFNAYGPTETTIMGTCTTKQPRGGVVTIGEPVRGFDAVVLDARLRPVGANVVGELFLGGAGLAQGYIGQPGLSATHFVANALGTPGERLYRTGDLVRWIEMDGRSELEFVGRADSQVKIRGHRVELAEVEAAVLRHPDVQQACVVGHAGTLAAYVVGDAEPRAVRAFLARTVPAFMVPSTVTAVDALPITLSGKVDVASLPTPSLPSAEWIAPSTPLELLVRSAFADVLDVPVGNIGVDDNFFDLGGHSLSVVQVTDALGEELSRPVPVSALLMFPTVGALASKLEAGADGVAADSDLTSGVFDVLLPLRADGTGAPLFCVHPAIGIAWSYLALLGETDRPVYGLQIPGIADDEQSPSSIEEFASRYVREIRAVQAHGPYHLLGWSLGGVIAHAVAAELQAEGEEISMLVEVDSLLSAPADAAEFGIEDLASQLGVAGSSFEGIAAQLRYDRSELGFLGAGHLEKMYAPVAEAPRWVSLYRPRVFKGEMTYMAARDSIGAGQWNDFVDGPITVHRVDVEHEDMLGEIGARAVGRVIGTVAVTEGVAR
ncbi:amino acid adenylation domain-containing protein [Rhodococcus sp. G-MC3]|uniref:non-ribosomal peptide synthetase n=1 Tax=Rhodococcus sp. G-MC3 TaxID=3046209 RepID=UPI0024BA45D6|nr:non-ribosomal peptide synthetase [Rhodococcus sp. G-MC3]MDJ0396353.1 amino acid adenylation domain-containing protein [Rhodococcus sp. G-MC3]